MRIAVAAAGSDGDILPFIALAQGLRRTGHDAWLVIPEEFRRFAADIPVRESGAPPRKESAIGPLPLSRMKNPIAKMKLLASDLAEGAMPTLPKVRAAIEGADLVVHHHMDLAAFTATEIHRIPRVCAWIAGIPWVDPALHDHWSERLYYRAHDAVHWKLQYALAEPYFNQVLRAAGLAPRQSVTRALWDTDLLLIAISHWVTSPSRRLPRGAVQTGFWFNQESSFSASAELSKFLATGDAPVVVSFGSTALEDPEKWSNEVLSAVAASGRRALLVGGHAEIGKGRLPETVFRTDYVPFDWLFSRVSCVIHHGGAGTTALALRAGIPQAVAWQISDQPRWGATVHRLGVGARPVSASSFSAAWVRKSIIACTTDERMRTRAQALARKIRAEDGIADAIAHIERHTSELGMARRG